MTAYGRGSDGVRTGWRVESPSSGWRFPGSARTGHSGLDTNMRSCWDGDMANVRSTVTVGNAPGPERGWIADEAAVADGGCLLAGGERNRCRVPVEDARPTFRPVHPSGHGRPGRPRGAPHHGAVRTAHRRALPRYRHQVVLRRQRLRRTLGGVAVAGALGLLAAPIWGHPTAVGGIPASPAVATFPRVYVVQRGDTLRSISLRVDGGRNERAVATDLRAQLNGAPLAPGVRLVLP